MPPFDPTPYQERPNGPLTAETIARVEAIKNRTGMSYAALGSQLTFSGTFLHNLVNKRANIGTQHIERIAVALERLENEGAAPASPSVAEGDLSKLDHSYHLRSGVQVSITLPHDLTEREAERLAQFIRSLPTE